MLFSFGPRIHRVHQDLPLRFSSFGGFASKYIKGKFFMDVHPPLAKMLIALTGWLAGFDGNFDFKEIGKDYLEPGVPYVSMRLFPAICGILLVPCMFFTLKVVGCRTMTAAMGASLIIFGTDFTDPGTLDPSCNAVQAGMANWNTRKRPPHPSSIDSARLPLGRRDCLHRPRLLLLHEST